MGGRRNGRPDPIGEQLPYLETLRAFKAAGRHCSYTLAGEELGITAQAVGKRVRTLEGALGETLLEYRNATMVLTDAGEELLRGLIYGFNQIAASYWRRKARSLLDAAAALGAGTPPPSPRKGRRTGSRKRRSRRRQAETVEEAGAQTGRPSELILRQAKLGEEDVHEIRRLAGKATVADIAARFNVTGACIRAILAGKTWRWLATEEGPVGGGEA